MMLASNANAVDKTHYLEEENTEKMFSTKNNFAETIKITWKAVDNVKKACDAESHRLGYGPYTGDTQACAFWDIGPFSKTCTVITAKSTNMHILGHEMRHCFQGEWHS